MKGGFMKYRINDIVYILVNSIPTKCIVIGLNPIIYGTKFDYLLAYKLNNKLHKCFIGEQEILNDFVPINQRNQH